MVSINKKLFALTVATPLAIIFFSAPSESRRVTSPRPFGYSIFDDGVCLNDMDCRYSEACGSLGSFGGVCKRRAAPSLGKRGSRCSTTTDCDQRAGLYCKEGFGNSGTCQPKLPNGERCFGGFGVNECRGFCKGEFQGSPGVCAPTVKFGSKCFRNFECQDAFLPNGKQDLGICTGRFGTEEGVCIRQSQLLTKLGAPCSRAADRCDNLRNLRCRWASSLRKTVCQQDGVSEGEYCKRGNALSRCGRGLVCRFPRTDLVTSGPFQPDVQPTQCLPRLRFRQAGEPCATESDVCAGNTKCRVVPGVLLFSSRLGPSVNIVAAYCVRTLKRWTQCSMKEKFLALCEDGFACKGGKCMRKGTGERTARTHAYGGASCSILPCGPGFKCGKNKACVAV